MDGFVNVIRKDPRARTKINNTLDRYMRLPYKNQSEIGYDCLIQIFIPKDSINKMGTTITVLYIELKMKISRIK